MKNEAEKALYLMYKENKSNAFYNKETGLTPKGKVLLGMGVFIAMALLAVLAGEDVGKALGEFIYNISH